jgi:dTDP-4-amino-4,6-dideoxygalactose transaminase
LKNFGFVDETTVVAPGINGKMSEFNAALGLLQLKHFNSSRLNREKSFNKYIEKLQNIKGLTIPPVPHEFISNYGYFPILIDEGYPLNRDAVFDLLKENDVVARRYFYPLISEFPMYRGLASASNLNLKIGFDASRKIICLPLFTNIDDITIQKICEILSRNTY